MVVVGQMVPGQQPKNQPETYTHSNRDVGQASREGEFGAIFGILSCGIKLTHGLEFELNITSLQLAQKARNLVMFWLTKHTRKFH